MYRIQIYIYAYAVQVAQYPSISSRDILVEVNVLNRSISRTLQLTTCINMYFRSVSNKLKLSYVQLLICHVS